MASDTDNHLTHDNGWIACSCGATVPDNPRYRARFLKRHPTLCSERREFAEQLATGTRSVDEDEAMNRTSAVLLADLESGRGI